MSIRRRMPARWRRHRPVSAANNSPRRSSMLSARSPPSSSEGVTRIAVGGGETTGAVVTALEADTLVIGPEIDPGVPALASVGDKPVAWRSKW